MGKHSSISSFTSESTSVYTYPDTTITSVVAIPTSAVVSNDLGSTASRNSKLIGGLVGSIGGTIVIGCLVVLFLFLKKRKRQITNQSPDFNGGGATNRLGTGDDEEDTSLEDKNDNIFHDSPNGNMKQSKLGWLTSIFSKNHNGSGNRSDANGAAITGSGAVAGVGGVAGAGRSNTFKRLRNADDLENQTYGATPQTNRGDAFDADDDGFAYRGVTNSNNLDSIFRSNGNTSSNARNSSYFGKNSTRGSSISGTGDTFVASDSPQMTTSPQYPNDQTRMNSYGHPLAHPDDFNFEEYPQTGNVRTVSGGTARAATAGAAAGAAAASSAHLEHPYTTTASSEYESDPVNTRAQRQQNYHDNDAALMSSSASSDGDFHPSDYDDELFILPGDEMVQTGGGGTASIGKQHRGGYVVPHEQYRQNQPHQLPFDEFVHQQQPQGGRGELNHPYARPGAPPPPQQYMGEEFRSGPYGSNNSLSRFQEDIS